MGFIYDGERCNQAKRGSRKRTIEKERGKNKENKNRADTYRDLSRWGGNGKIPSCKGDQLAMSNMKLKSKVLIIKRSVGKKLRRGLLNSRGCGR